MTIHVQRDMSDLDSSAVVIITRPPEIIACLKLRLKPRNIFIIFDSHPRPSYPDGAGMIISPSIEGAAHWLTELLPSVNLPDCVLQWQAQLLANYSGHMFVPHVVETSTATLWQADLEFSLAQLSMQAEIAELRSQNEFLKAEQQRLESELERAEARCQDRERLIRQQQQQAQQRQQHSSTPSSSKASTSTSDPFLPDSRSVGSSSGRALGHLDKPPNPSSDCDDSILAAMRLQNEFDEEDRALSAQLAELAKAVFNLFRPDFLSVGSSSGHALGHLDKPSTPPSDRDSILAAMRLQNEFDKEDRALSTQHAELAKTVQKLFLCDICLEEMPDDSIARPDPCQHTFCRECLRGHVAARLNEHRFPILCPSCSVSKGKGKEVAGGTCCERMVIFIFISCYVSLEISQSLALDLGLTDEQFSVWSEMEMVAFSVSVHCRKYVYGVHPPRSSAYIEIRCQRTMFVAKDEHEEAKVIPCPLPDCDHVWCKQCQQSIDVDGPKHSCDGTSELAHLVKQEGWKYCPSELVPVACYVLSSQFLPLPQHARHLSRKF
jgi:RING finger family protein